MSGLAAVPGVSELFSKSTQLRSLKVRADLVLPSMAEHVENSGEKPYWRKDDVASFCCVGRRTIENWMTHEGLPHIKIGNVVRFRPQDVKDFLETRRRVVRD